MKPKPKFKSRALFTIVGGSVLINPVFAQEQSRTRPKQCRKSWSPACAPSLETAQSIKLESDTFVDSITATDIGAFPDKSVAEALQRVPGITVSRLQSSDDSNHFSAEPSSVLIRGLTFVRTQFNGRDSFSADGYRGLNFNDVSPELMAGRRLVQEPDRGDDRRRHRRRREPAHAPCRSIPTARTSCSPAA